MVVVLLVAVLATLAAPSFQKARNDRVAFDYARQYQQILVQGRSRAAGTGSAHLAILSGGTGGRGVIRLYAALDGEALPGPVSSCRFDPAQWTVAEPEIADFRIDNILPGNTVKFISYADVNREGINTEMDLKAALTAGDGTANATMNPFKAVAVCITPAGVTYVGYADTVPDAVANMRSATPFTGIVEASIQRHEGGTGVGLRRRVVIAGGGAPRLRSE